MSDFELFICQEAVLNTLAADLYINCRRLEVKEQPTWLYNDEVRLVYCDGDVYICILVCKRLFKLYCVKV